MSDDFDVSDVALVTLHLAQEVRKAMHWPEKFKAEKELELMITAMTVKDAYTAALMRVVQGQATAEDKELIEKVGRPDWLKGISL